MADLFGNAAKTDDYDASNIEVLEGLEPVRHRPGMYIGGTDDRALHHLAAEILDNSMDEAVAGHANRIDIHLESADRLTQCRQSSASPASPLLLPLLAPSKRLMTATHGRFHDTRRAKAAAVYAPCWHVCARLW